MDLLKTAILLGMALLVFNRYKIDAMTSIWSEKMGRGIRAKSGRSGISGKWDLVNSKLEERGQDVATKFKALEDACKALRRK